MRRFRPHGGLALLSTTASYLSVSNNLARQQAATASDPQVKNDTAYYLANIGSVTSIADFVGNYRLFSYAMKAYGLEDMDYAKGLITKVLQGGVTSSKALANTLTDPRYKAFAKAFDFAGKGAERDLVGGGDDRHDRQIRRAEPRGQAGPAEQRRPARALLHPQRAVRHQPLWFAGRQESA